MVTCNPLVIRDEIAGQQMWTVWCRACQWESEATTWQRHAELIARRHRNNNEERGSDD